MRIGKKHYRTIWMEEDMKVISVIDQRKLPFEFSVLELRSLEDACMAISEMVVRGAPLIGVTAAFGMYLAILHSKEENWQDEIHVAGNQLVATRPTAVNLKYAVDLCLGELDFNASKGSMVRSLFHLAQRLAEDEVIRSRKIGDHGLELVRELHKEKGTVNILTHCNAGWLACVDYGTATAPIYRAWEEGIPIHVWVDETRPRNQGARLTAYELGEEGVPHTVITDNAGGLLMQQGNVDLVLVGSDRTSNKGDVVNKIGTYLKALAANDNHIPFYVALPTSTIDPGMVDGQETEIEFRNGDEVIFMEGWAEEDEEITEIRLIPESSPVANPGFDVTPARLVTGLITEKGIIPATEEGIKSLFGA